MTKKMASIVANPDVEEKQEVFNMLASDMTNIEISKATGLTYAQVLAYRIAFEKRCNREVKHSIKNS